MSQLNTLALRDALIGRITDFALDDHFVRDEKLASVLRKIWSGPPETGGLGSDLWVEGAFPSTTAEGTMQDLVDRGIVHRGLAKQLDSTGAFPLHLAPYEHQWRSIECAARSKGQSDERPAIVVTAGTGAGKTESFLIPLLNELWSSPSEPGQGVRALILYPMNALVNDQVERLDKWLDGQDRVSFFHFTSETPENANIANKRDVKPATGARFRTRKQARGWENHEGKPLKDGGGPTPDILVTNYSMLEYMLCRPQDAVFFGSNLRVVVLDEAHIYSGNLAAEITLLLRRVLMRCGRSPEEVLSIATSATIGGGPSELRPFASTIFSKPDRLVEVIEGRPQRPIFQTHEATLPLSSAILDGLSKNPIPHDETLVVEGGKISFKKASEESWTRWSIALSSFVPESALTEALAQSQKDRHVGPMLEHAVGRSPAVAALQGVLWNQGKPLRLPLRVLSERIFGLSNERAIEATRQLLQVGAIARGQTGALPLVANRVHYLMRGPEGIHITFGKESPAARGIFSLNSDMAVFSVGADPATLDDSATHPLTLFRCNQSGWWGVAGKQVEDRLEPVSSSTILYGDDQENDNDEENPITLTQSRIRYFSLQAVVDRPCIYFDPATGRYGSQGGVVLWEVETCPISETPLTPDNVGWFAARARLQLSVLAETALAAMPEYPDDTKAWKPARGRRLLVFSDSRAEAARLGPRLTRQHELQVFRAAVVDQIDRVNLAASEDDQEMLRQEIASYRAELESATPARQAMLQRRISQAEEDLQQMGEGGSVRDWTGVIKDSAIASELYHAPDGKNHQPGNKHAHEAWNKNKLAIQQSLASLLGRELARRPGWPNPSLETLGLVEVFYPGVASLQAPTEILGILSPDVAIRLEALWPDFLAALLDSVRNQGAVTLGSDEADRDYQYGNGLLGKSFSQDQAYRRSMIPLIGQFVEGTQVSRRNAFARNVLVAIGLDMNKASELVRPLLAQAFSALAEGAQTGSLLWLKREDSSPTNNDNAVISLQINFAHLGLRRPSKLFQCKRTGQVWPRNVAGLFPGATSPCLTESSHDEIDGDLRLGRRRRELRDWEGFKLGLWAEEHSAQLSPEENARLQNLFREGRRNILSSTTTLELGIDIGGLSAVLLGNLPPGKANYLQRAGRAGRRADGTSAVIGFARPSAYEREVFLEFGRYLDQDLRRPTVFLERAPLVRRHAHAWLLGEFIRSSAQQAVATGAMNSYGKMGEFTSRPLPAIWRKNEAKPELLAINQKPISEDFLSYLEELAETEGHPLQDQLARLWSGCANLTTSAASWSNTVHQIRDAYRKAVADWVSVYDELLAAWKEIPAKGVDTTETGYLRSQANAIFYQLLALHKLTVIESLGDARVLPRYGFPIGLSRLRVQVSDSPHSTKEEDQFRLQRDGMMALREYAPGSQLLAGGQVITSRGLLKHWTGAIVGDEAWGLRGRFVKTNTGLFNYSVSAHDPEITHTFGQAGTIRRGEFLFPRHGFTTAAWDPPRYGSDFEKVGSVEVFTLAFENQKGCDQPIPNFGSSKRCVATYRNAGELFLLNSGEREKGFAICQKCGYAESEVKRGAGRVDLPRRYDFHAPLHSTYRGFRCWAEGEAPVWRNHHLAAKQTTNLLKLDFGSELNPDLLYTIGHVLRLAGAMMLAIDERELGLLDPAPDPVTGGYRSVILYDSLAGGSGHLAELSHPEHPEFHRAWMERALTLLTIEGRMSDSLRQREAIRRLLTANCDDSRLVPGTAFEFLKQLLNPDSEIFEEGVQLSQNASTPWRYYENRSIPENAFKVWINNNEITGVQAGDLELTPILPTDPPFQPATNQIVLMRTPDGELYLGRWFYLPQKNAERPHRLKVRRLVEPYSQDLTPAEFGRVSILAVHIHP
jgi:hypothetical protein